jgi:hypothetical protein
MADVGGCRANPKVTPLGRKDTAASEPVPVTSFLNFFPKIPIGRFTISGLSKVDSGVEFRDGKIVLALILTTSALSLIRSGRKNELTYAAVSRRKE